MTDLIDKVARAIARPENLECAWENFTEEARAAIAVVIRDQLTWDKPVTGLVSFIVDYARENGIEL